MSERHGDLPVRLEARVGSRVAHLLELAGASTLVVLGRDLANPLERLVTGAVSSRVAARVCRPCVVVPAGWQPSGRPSGVVVGLKSGLHAEQLLRVAFERAASSGTQLRVVHAWQLPEPYVSRFEHGAAPAAWLAEGGLVLEKLVKPWSARYPGVEVVVEIVRGHAARELVRVAADADVLVVGRSRTRVPRLGATAHTLMLSAQVPVEIVPAEPEVTDDLVLEESGELLR